MLVFAGCGGSGGALKEQAQAKKAYVTRADAICETQEAERARLEQRVDGLAPITGAETHKVAVLLRRAADALAEEGQKLGALHPPSGVQPPDSFLSILDDQINDLRGFAAAYESRDLGAIRTVQARIADDSAKASALAEHYGFQVCGDPGNGNPGNLTRFR